MVRWLCAVLCSVLPLALVAQERTFPVPAGVTIDGVPPIPMSLVEAVAPYGQFRQARLIAWHPVERQILITTMFGNVNQLHYLRFPGGARTQWTFFSDGVAQRPSAAFTPKGDALVLVKDLSGGKELNQLLRYDVAGRGVTLLSDGTSRNGSPAMSPTGTVAYDSTRRNGKDRDLYLVDPSDPGTTRLLTQTEGAWSAIGWSPDGKSLLALQTISTSETYLWKVQVPGGEKTLLTPKGDRPVRWAVASGTGTGVVAVCAFFAPDGRTIYALSNRDNETNRIWRLDGETWTPLTPARQAIENFALSPDGRMLAAVVDDGSSSRLQLMDAAGRAVRTPAVPPGVLSDLQWHPTRKEVAFNLAGARSFSDVYSVDVVRGRLERWTFSEMGGANPETLPDAEIVRWKSFDGLELSGLLYRPAPRFTGPRPVIVNIHGGPLDRERPRNIGRSNYLRNELGIAVLYPNVRGSAGYGRTFEELDNGRLRENAIKDIGSLLDWIGANPAFDEDRVMLTGPSYGGYLTLAAGAEYAGRVRALNPAFGMTDLPAFLESRDMSIAANRNIEYGDPADPAMRAFLTRISPLTNAAKIKVPVYIAAGGKDTRVPIAQAEAMVAALKANGTPVWYVRLDEAGHQQLTVATNDYSIYTLVMFVKRYLVNQDTP